MRYARALLVAIAALAACSSPIGGGEPALLPAWAALSSTPVPVTDPAPPFTTPDPATCRARFSQWINGFGTRDVAYDLCLDLSLGALAQRAEMDVWRSGPHRIEEDGTLVPTLYEVGSAAYGRYNPAFVAWAIDNGIVGEDRPMLRAATQNVYDRRFRDIARVFWTARQRDDDPAVRSAAEGYRRYLATGAIPEDASDYQGGYTMNVFRDAAEAWARDYAAPGRNDWEAVYTAQTAYGFWVRREEDGTAELFEDGLRRLLATYDASWLAAN